MARCPRQAQGHVSESRVRYLTAGDILRINESEVGPEHLADFGLLESAVLRPQQTVAGALTGYDARVVSVASPREALERLDPERRRAVEAFRDRVRAMLGDRLRDLRLFGSQARGEPGPESDVDLLVLVEGFDDEIWRSVLDLAHSISPWLTPMIEDFERYHSPRSRATGIYQEIRKESVRL